jgi:tripartite ATP-independent transporter DctP family solute receptor
MKKTVFAALAAALLVLMALVSGCGGPSGGQQGDAPAGGDPPAAGTEAAGGDPPAAGTEAAGGYGEYSAENPLLLKLSNFAPNERNQLHKLCVAFEEKIEARTGGAVDVEIYMGGVLGNDRESLDSVIAGTLDMAANNTPIMSNYVDVFQVLDLAYLFKDYEHIYSFLESDVCQELQDAFTASGARMLCVQAVGYRNFDLVTGPVRTPDDLKGLTVRVTDSPIYLADYRAWGANPLIIAGPEVMPALQQGAIDGTDNTNNVQESEGYAEFAKYVTISQHAVHFNGLTINNALFESLAPALQDEIYAAAKEAAAERSRALQQEDPATLESIEKQQGGIISYDIDKQAFIDLMQPVYEDFRANHSGGKYLDRILALAE